MTVQVSVTAIKPKKIDAMVFVRDWQTATHDFADNELRRDFDATQSTFKRKFPIILRDRSGRNIIAWACIVDGEIYVFISEGTGIRWALMSSDWRSKTQPGRLKPGRGRGGVVIAGRRAMTARNIRPRPGIKGRKFDKQIAKKEQTPFKRKIQQVTERAAGRLFT